VRLPDAWGWGRGAVDRSPPIASPAAQTRARELALRHSLEALADQRLGPTLHPHFDAGDADAHARFVRLLTTVRALVETQLPQVRRRLRCETIDTEREMRAPSGGRIDPMASLRRAATRGSDIPELWVVNRRERLVDTPVNRLIVFILRDVETKLDACLQRRDAPWRAMAGERGLLHDAHQRLAHFFATTPLDALAAPKVPIARLRSDAARRRAEYERIAPLYEWWQGFERAHLDALRGDDADDTLAADGCYELCAALGLALALRRRCAPTEPTTPGALAFRGAGVHVELRFGQRAPGSRHGRESTAWLTVRRDGVAPREVLVEARNQRDATAAELAQRLDLWIAHNPGARAVLLTPAAPEAHDDDALVWRPFLPALSEGAERCDPVSDWNPLLDALLAP
jgi:hypothetical protein